MTGKKIHTSDLNALLHLVTTAKLCTIVFDPFRRLTIDDHSPLHVVSKQADISRIAAKHQGAFVCLVNLGGELPVGNNIEFIVEFNSAAEYPGWKKTAWRYIQNPNGSLRWLYPSGASRPWFLAFYNFDYWKARCYKLLVKTAFFFRCSRLVATGGVTVHARHALYLDGLLNKPGGNQTNYAVFTGTAGPNRKLVLAIAGPKGVGHFVKIALNEQSATNLRNEYASISRLPAGGTATAVVPCAEQTDDGSLRLSNIKPARHKKLAIFGDTHTRFLKELYQLSFGEEQFCRQPFYNTVADRLQRIADHPALTRTPLAPELYRQLSLLYRQLEVANPLVSTAAAHGDFTRWNCYLHRDKLYVYDWELGSPSMPLLFDFFHYIIQVSVFADNAGAGEIEKRLEGALQLEAIRQLAEEYKIDTRLHLQLYLLLNTSYYLDLYLQQQSLHGAGQRLFAVWHQLLLKEMVATGGLRTQFIGELFGFLLPLDYVVLKSAGKPMSSLSAESDIDLLVKPGTASIVLAWIQAFAGVQKTTCVRRSFMTTIQVFFADSSFVSIDLLHAFHRKGLDYLDAPLLLQHAIVRDGVKLLPPAWDYLYIFLFYQCNFSDVPVKYADQYIRMAPEEENQLLKVLAGETGIKTTAITGTFVYMPGIRAKIVAFLKEKRKNNLWRRSWRLLRHGVNVLTDLLHNRGLVLTFSGVDGAGKSTILNDMRELLQKKYRRKVVVLRHRPSMLPIISAWKYGKEAADRRCVESLPRQGTNNSLLSSLIRFGYYYLDYLVGQIIVYARYTLRGYVVLYDRYYFDFIVDGRRSNISINRSFIKSLYRFVYKPQLNVFLYAQPEVILRRKQELSADDISSLTLSYTRLFSGLGHTGRYLCIENNNKKETLYRIEQAFIQLN